MKILMRIMAFLVFLTMSGPALAQTPELRPTPQPGAGLWQTVILPPTGPSLAYAGSADQACRIQHQSLNPVAIYMGAKSDGAGGYCEWDLSLTGGIYPTLIYLICPGGQSPKNGICVPDSLRPVPICNGDCGASPLAGTPQTNIGNPININSGLKVQTETDYASADGLFTVDRQYLSRHGHGWQALMPGYLEMYGWQNREVNFISRGGNNDYFAINSWQDQNNWTWSNAHSDGMPVSASRRKLSMVTTPTMGRGDFIRDQNISTTGPAEMRLDMANGEYILFRRANSSLVPADARRLVPVEHGKPGGYKIWYDYNDTGLNPYRIRDSLNRQMLLTWIDARGETDSLGLTGTKVVSAIVLPDTTKLEYTYDDSSSSFNVPVPVWATQLGLDVRGVVNGTINVKTTGRKDRLRSVVRKTAAGTTLWQRNFDYGYNWNASAMTRVRDQTGATLAEYSYTSRELLATSRLAGNVIPHRFQHYQVFYGNEGSEFTVRRVTPPLGGTEDYWLQRKGASTVGEPSSIVSINRAATLTTPADEQKFGYIGYSAYGANLLLNKTIDQLGRETQYNLEGSNGRPISTTQAAGTPVARQTSFAWHPVWDLPTRVERDGVRVDTTYNANAMVASQTLTDLTTGTAPYSTNGQARTISYNWGSNARLLSVNGPRAVDAQGRDDVVTFAYDTAGNVTTMTNALGYITRFAGYDANGRPATMTDPNNAVTQFSYDPLGRTTSVTIKHPTAASLDAITTFTYDTEGRVKTVTAPASTALTMNYDLAGLLKSVVASNGERIDYSHDAMGNVTSQITKRTTGTAANTITNTFDALGRLLTETLGTGRKWTYAYDKVGNLTGVVTPRNQSTAHSFDALDRLVSSTLPDAGAPALAYDQRDGVVENTDPLGVKTTFVRNGFGEAIQEINPDRGTSVYYYNSAGDKTAAIDGRGQRIDYVYDILGRLISATPTANTAITYTWDTPSLTGSFAKGRLSRISDANSTVEYAYDHRGNINVKRQRIGTGAWMQLAFAYDLADRRNQITYPSGRIVNYTFDTLGRVTQVRTKASAAITTWTTVSSGMTYEAFGAITRANYGNGTRMIQSWGNDGRLANRRLETTATSVRLSSLTYTYDTNDNFSAIADTLDATKSRTYAYDAMDRLSRVTGPQGGFAREDFVYDRNGNRIRVERRVLETAATPSQTDTYTRTANTNRINRLVTPAGATTFTQDARGNQSVERWPNGSVITVAYDGFARLTRYKVGLATQAMLYNGDDERIRVVTTPEVGLADTRIYMYDLDHRLVGEYGAAGVSDVKAEYIWTLPQVGAAGPTGGDDGLGGYMPLAVVVGAAADLRWVHSHHNGAPILMTSAAGAIVPHGDHAVMGFPGQYANAKQLAGAQHYYNRYRDYNAATGRYIQADPIGLAGDDNPYAYAMGNALRYNDPTGLMTPPRAPPPTSIGRPANAFDAQVRELNARGRELDPRYQGFPQLGNGATARDVIAATNMFARAQAEWAFKNGICLGTGQPGASGIIYLRIDTSGRLAPYYGQSINPSRFAARQGEHSRAFPNSSFQFISIGQAVPGRALSIAEHNAIQGLTGGVAARTSPLVSNQRDAVGANRRPSFGLTEPR